MTRFKATAYGRGETLSKKLAGPARRRNLDDECCQEDPEPEACGSVARGSDRRNGALMPRYCLLGHVNPAKLETYRERHARVWPELLRALADAGWRNYSLFLRNDGLLIGYVEADDLAEAQRRVSETDVNARWQAAMSDLFADLEGAAPDVNWELVPEVFNLEDQLAPAAHPSGTPVNEASE